MIPLLLWFQGPGDGQEPAQGTRVPVATPAAEPWLGHVFDGETGRPLPGVACELWTEGLDAPFELVASTATSAAGGFELPRGRGEKLLLRKEGYRTTVVGTSDDEVRLFPCGQPFTLRVLDLEDRPIAGATVRTHQTCRHAPPAVSGTTDAAGRVSFADFPPAADNPELEVSAPGHGALGQLFPFKIGPDLYLPRRAPVRLLLLETDGRPLAEKRCTYEGDEGWFAFTTDSTGRAVLESTFVDRNVALAERQAGLRRNIGDGYPPGREEWALRVDGSELPERGMAVLRLYLDVPIDEEWRALLRVFHDEGWAFQGPGEHGVPAGTMRVVVGAPFSGICERITPLALAEGEERTLELLVEVEPNLEILLPDGYWTVHIQAGDDSVTRYAHEGVLEASVPPGQPVIVLAQGAEIRRARLDPLWESVTLDLRTSAVLVRPARAGGEPAGR